MRDERQKLTEAAIKLGEERTQLMQERRAFEQTKHAHDTLAVLDELSDTTRYVLLFFLLVNEDHMVFHNMLFQIIFVKY